MAHYLFYNYVLEWNESYFKHAPFYSLKLCNSNIQIFCMKPSKPKSEN